MSGVNRTYNLVCDNAIASIIQTLGANERYYDSVRVRYVRVRGERDWYSPITLIQIFLKAQKPTGTDDLLYSNIELREMWFSIECLLKQLNERKFELPEMTIQFGESVRWERAFLASNNNYGRNPGFSYRAIWQQSLPISNQEIVLNYHLPYFPDILTAIRKWIQIEMFSDSDIRNGGFILFVPECRAEFKGIRHSGNNIEIEVRAENSLLGDLKIRGGWVCKDGFYPFDADVPNDAKAISCVKLEIPENIEKFEAFLIGSDESLYDYHRETRMWWEGISRVIGQGDAPGSTIVAIQNALRSGEDGFTEFKSFIEPKHQKINELIETVIAFANTGGGMVLVGIRDNCEIVGVDGEIKKKARHEQVEIPIALTRYTNELLQSIKARVVPSVDATSAPVSIADRTLVVIKVPEGNAKPYRDIQNGKLYVRHGANNVQPNNEELREFCKA